MPTPPSRPFTILDTMAFMAATAVGLALARWVYPSRGGLLQDWVWVWGNPASCIAVAWGLLLLLYRLRAPRPRWRRLARRPGFVASAATFGSILIGVVLALAHATYTRSPPGVTVIYTPNHYWGSATEMIPTAIGGAWLALALGGRWDPEPEWVDRMGRGLGVFWLAIWPARILQPFIAYFIYQASQ